jgi:hypothetical protein
VYDRERRAREAIVFLLLLLVTMALIVAATIYIGVHLYGLTPD